jgi:hypothetical protein
MSWSWFRSSSISNMSLNGLRRRVATRDKTQTKTHMDEPLVVMDLGHQVLAIWAPLLSLHCSKKCFFAGSLGLGFFSMRHAANSEQEADFQEQCVG